MPPGIMSQTSVPKGSTKLTFRHEQTALQVNMYGEMQLGVLFLYALTEVHARQAQKAQLGMHNCKQLSPTS